MTKREEMAANGLELLQTYVPMGDKELIKDINSTLKDFKKDKIGLDLAIKIISAKEKKIYKTL